MAESLGGSRSKHGRMFPFRTLASYSILLQRNIVYSSFKCDVAILHFDIVDVRVNQLRMINCGAFALPNATKLACGNDTALAVSLGH